MRQSAWQTAMGILLLCIVALISWQAGTLAVVQSQNVRQASEKRTKYRIVLDAGHGGNDPGKVGIGGQLEKDINLEIVRKLKAYLEASDVEVILTRDSDAGLYSSGDSHKKMADMRKRCEIIEEAKPDLAVSIHQNSYHEEYVSGGQVFYYKTSEKGKYLAELLQERFDYVLGEDNKRLAKANGSYYLLLHVKTPIVIVECGFLSNGEEAARLEDPAYQDRLAWTIHMGIMEYLNTEESGS
ncbi:N-acetylmuramoyl-L-alanine amidase [Lacrimispora sp. 210928-DFI.3.58]|uniref:N-acetylmuramoyl-L-alanine amidase n=1 Tax=Lacrimispora sp. 210928-DFI.3.58 TaxID=2883214 RepID=UPI0015B3D995|nr:N-acetylmuramoyl-L-alanine amidase [Lacrimispora sp. 210928-DFI.3.58]MCB7320180.1 N-acetylmuramoyl-L-alanine amidase [Lacrimispora sp. 210928-DFI.3.58]